MPLSTQTISFYTHKLFVALLCTYITMLWGVTKYWNLLLLGRGKCLEGTVPMLILYSLCIARSFISSGGLWGGAFGGVVEVKKTKKTSNHDAALLSNNINSDAPYLPYFDTQHYMW